MPGENLWVCHRCKRIGSGFEAGRHVDETGHEVVELSAEMTEAVRAELAKSQPHPSAADFLTFARFQREAERIRASRGSR